MAYLFCAEKDLLDFLSIMLNERETWRKEEGVMLSCVARGLFHFERLTTLPFSMLNATALF